MNKMQNKLIMCYNVIWVWTNIDFIIEYSNVAKDEVGPSREKEKESRRQVTKIWFCTFMIWVKYTYIHYML